MIGMSAADGSVLDGEDHLRQSIADILQTPIGTRIARRDYGSMLFEMIDQPVTPATVVRLFAVIATALLRWEPRIRLRQVSIVAGDQPGAFVVDLVAERTDLPVNNSLAQMTVPLRLGASAVGLALN